MVQGVEILAQNQSQAVAEILTEDALTFLAALHRTFNATRLDLLIARETAQQRLDAGVPLEFPPETAHIRADPTWLCAPPAPGLEDRRVEITGPPDRKMVVNALNSGSKTFMADFEGTPYFLALQLDSDFHVIAASASIVILFRLMCSYFCQLDKRSSQLARCHSTPD